jgi:hypothetical protein
MPTVSLRLSEQQHQLLVEWAYASHRSVQRELVHRLFGGGMQVGEAAVTPGATIRLEPGQIEPLEGPPEPGGPPMLSERDQAGQETPAGKSGELAAVPAGDQPTRPESPQRSDPPRSDSSRCSAATPRGTRCKTCGKVHTW